MTLLEEVAQQRTNQTLVTVLNATIEKIATDAARELLRDPVFRATLKAAATGSIRRGVRDLLRNGHRRPARRRKNTRS
jgi:hypothetical protein